MLEIMRVVLALVVACATALSLPALPLSAQAKPTPDAIARALQERYQTIRDFSGEFTQTYRSGALRTQSTERGTVAVKKPGRMRWIYSKPARKEFVSDGSKIYFYQPDEKQVQVTPIPPDNQATSSALFLAGKGDIVRDFTPSFSDTTIPGTVALRLVPRRAEPDYEYLVVVIDPGTLQIRALTTRDHQGGESTLIFARLKENTGISDKEFDFRIPRGVDVVSNE
jgi:outer membrane lipoprotein carrier protein